MNILAAAAARSRYLDWTAKYAQVCLEDHLLLLVCEAVTVVPGKTSKRVSFSPFSRRVSCPPYCSADKKREANTLLKKKKETLFLYKLPLRGKFLEVEWCVPWNPNLLRAPQRACPVGCHRIMFVDNKANVFEPAPPLTNPCNRSCCGGERKRVSTALRGLGRVRVRLSRSPPPAARFRSPAKRRRRRCWRPRGVSDLCTMVRASVVTGTDFRASFASLLDDTGAVCRVFF